MDTIPLEAKIIAVADIFQALVQKRPYRETLSKDKVKEIMCEMVNKGEIDKSVFKYIYNNIDFYYEIALNPKDI